MASVARASHWRSARNASSSAEAKNLVPLGGWMTQRVEQTHGDQDRDIVRLETEIPGGLQDIEACRWL